MKLAETVTFGGSALDRAAELRGDAVALGRLAARPGARVVWLRGGEPLVEGPEEAPRLARTPLAEAPGTEPVFLGREDGEGVWAAIAPGEEMAAGGRRWVELRGVMAGLSPRDAELAVTAKAVLGWHLGHGFCAVCGTRSNVAMAGWRRDCPNCKSQHFPRTDPVVIMLITRGNDVLLGRSPGWPEGMHSLLAGFMEPGETVEAAVRREVWEEAGVRVGRVDYLASQPWPFPASLMLGCRGEALSGGITLDPNELEAALWVPRERLMRVFLGQDAQIRAPRVGAIAGFLMRKWLEDRLD
ncbi:NADH pyrophosphatase [Rubellimicrobium mesophilum DSM 19309]|uniref:NAD(+) diphosphatase n=1 Tax=Rubellimicrobium mesophilum DSM 19309 TaxID=442562 RepID=A0A017HJM4_9RHOB|nr:NAD(+) diphosphatase [Rubellimicrobium mesophilum]EYD74515.1 NADH pyrophosphatase [Rubellimicrobium mesophilum DSM 19309]